jgi:hypothetical protein
MGHRIAALAAIAALAGLGPAAAAAAPPPAASPSGAPPKLSERTEALFVTPPSGWVVSVWRGGTVELGEFTPAGQTGAAYVDLLGYSVVPRIAGTNDTETEMRTLERRQDGCRVLLSRDHDGLEAWYDSEYLCIGREGAAAPDTVEIEFASTRLGKQSVFRVWRSWRGSPKALEAMLKERFGLDLAPVKGEGAEAAADEAALDEAFAALGAPFFADIRRSEACDLSAPEHCAGLHTPVPAALQDTVPKQPFIGGFVAPAQHRVTRDEFRAAFRVTSPDDGTPNRVIARLLPSDPAWTDPAIFQKAVLAVGMGQAADGGAMYLIDRPGVLSPADRTRALARLLAASRQLWQPGHAADTVVVLGPSADAAEKGASAPSAASGIP